MDYDKFLSKICKKRKENLIRFITEMFIKNPTKCFSFAGGMPNAKMFPFNEVSVTYSDGTIVQLEGDDLDSAFQYGPCQGFPPLVKQWRDFQMKWHSPKYNDWDVHFTPGSMEGCIKIFEMLVEKDEPIMIQSPTYTAILCALLPMEPDLISLGMDNEGVLPSDIVKVCEERLSNNKSLPKFLYVNPVGANPVGLSYSNKRKEDIYKLAQKYDFLIVEDDAYFFLDFSDKHPRSLLSMDVDGRVLRLDSFSKILSPGIRLGVVTGPKPLLEKLNLHQQVSTLQANSLAQVMISKLLKSWSDDDLNEHLSKIQKFYRDRRDFMLKILEKHFKDIGEWSVPNGGMFCWVRITALEDVYDVVLNKCVPQGLFVLPGHAFYPDETKPCQYLRICYSQVHPENMEEGLSKIATLIREAVVEKNNKNTK